MTRTAKIRLIVSGCCGRMGSRILTLAHQSDDIVIAGAVESSGHPSLGKDIGECIGLGHLGERVVADLARVARAGDVIVDFSTPDATVLHAQTA